MSRIKKKLKSLKDQQKLDNKTYLKIRPSDATTARFYGLPKIHKPNIPLRPIVSLPGSPTYELSKYLASILKPLVATSTHSIKNANTFLDHIRDLKIEPDETMLSFDVVSLFTSIPLPTARRITNDLLTTNSTWTNNTQLSKTDILDLLDLCLSTEFQFEETCYRQTSGTPMGSPLSSFLAEAVMQDLERQALANNKNVKLWDRYVDDVMSIAKTHHIENLFHTINNTTDGITFTMEKEKDGQIAFMDIKITRTDNGSIETDVYRKRTHTDQILNYNSNHPTQHKVSCLKTLLNRIDTHCSTTESKKKELDYLYDTFRKNNYPKHFIDSVYKRRQQNRTQDTSTEENNERPIRRITLPYINKISETTARILDKHNLKVAHKPTNKLKSIFTTHKDQTDLLDKHNVIYQIPCKDCEKVYIGETSKTVKSRITEHKNAIKREDSRSLPAAHVINNDHSFDWTKTTVLSHANTREARELKEAWHSHQKPAINRHIDIPTAYQPLQQHQDIHRGSNTEHNQPINTVQNQPINNVQNQPINVHQNQPITDQTNQPIRRSLRLRNQTHIKASHLKHSHTT
jgi:hypothetical protein